MTTANISLGRPKFTTPPPPLPYKCDQRGNSGARDLLPTGSEALPSLPPALLSS